MTIPTEREKEKKTYVNFQRQQIQDHIRSLVFRVVVVVFFLGTWVFFTKLTLSAAIVDSLLSYIILYIPRVRIYTLNKYTIHIPTDRQKKFNKATYHESECAILKCLIIVVVDASVESPVHPVGYDHVINCSQLAFLSSFKQ